MEEEYKILCPGSREQYIDILDDLLNEDRLIGTPYMLPERGTQVTGAPGEAVLFLYQPQGIDTVISVQATKDTPPIEPITSEPLLTDLFIPGDLLYS